MGLLKTIFFFLFFYYLFKFLLRILTPFFITIIARNFNARNNQNFNNNVRKEREGEVSIDKKKKNSKKDINQMGEYIDFEEIDE